MLEMRTWVTAVSIGAGLWLLPAAPALQIVHSSDPAIFIQPRERPAPPAPAGVKPLLRIDSSLVLIPVHVTDPIGKPVVGLKAENFHIFEDRIEQQIATILTEEAPVSIGFLFDASGSMRSKMKKASEAAAAFFRTTNPEDEFFLIQFNDRARLMEPFTRDSEQVYQQIAHARPTGRTTLLDAIYMATGQMKKARHLRKALVILSDGGDNWSRRSAREIRSALIESDVQVYAMGIFDADLSVKHPAEEKNGPQLLDEITELTGGRHYPVPSIDQLPEISEKIGRELRSQYVLGYYPTNPETDAKYRQVVVKLDAPNARDLRLYYRRGYYAPAD
jgi:Ca-activated chloride channel family protein